MASRLASPIPIGPNFITAHEERLAENDSFQIATQIDFVYANVGESRVLYFSAQQLAQDLLDQGLTE